MPLKINTINLIFNKVGFQSDQAYNDAIFVNDIHKFYKTMKTIKIFIKFGRRGKTKSRY